MEHIKPEEFLKQPKRVQEELKKWCEDNLQKYDWVYLIREHDILPIDSVMDTRKDDINIGRVFYIGNCLCWSSIYDPNIIPLLIEGQLRKFIEDKTNSKIESLYIVDRGYSIRLSRNDENGKNLIFKKLRENLFKAYWEVACKIVEEG